MGERTSSADAHGRSLVTAGMVLGIGLGGFVDGIVFHQILQLHNMLSARIPVRGVDAKTLAINLEINMFWDGLFHAFTWTATVIGLAMLWRAVTRAPAVARPSGAATDVRDARVRSLSGKAFVGALLLGWGLFNLVEGVLDHHVLHLHHVTETEGHLVWDIAFLVSGRWAMIRAGRRERHAT